MCPLSGMVQFLIVIVLMLLLGQFTVAQLIKINYSMNKPTIHMYETVNVGFNITADDPSVIEGYKVLSLYSENPDILQVRKDIELNKDAYKSRSFSGNFNMTGNFLGSSKVLCTIRKQDSAVQALESLDVVVIRQVRTIDTVFTASVATLVSIIYINFGCALNWSELKMNLKRPIGPAIGFVCQFIAMPLISYFLGNLLFPTNTAMRLGLFFTGVSPAGGASNVWTAILDGNIDLSITMTTISTFAAFAMMPLWLFTLGKTIFNDANLAVPYNHIGTYAVALVVPLFIGYLLQRYCKRIAQFLTRILKGFSSLLIIFIVVFAIIANLYLFQLFSWQIILCGLGLPWLGYSIGWCLAKICKQEPRNALAIAVETGVQNTGIAIFLLRFALPQPQADLTTVVPVAVAIMTPFPLIVLFIIKKIKDRVDPTKKKIISSIDDFEAENHFNITADNDATETLKTNNNSILQNS